MIPETNPLAALAITRNPSTAAWAIEELRRAGFADPERIARDFGWVFDEEVTTP